MAGVSRLVRPSSWAAESFSPRSSRGIISRDRWAGGNLGQRQDHGRWRLPREMLCYVAVMVSGGAADLGPFTPDSGEASKVEAGDGCLGSLGKRRGGER